MAVLSAERIKITTTKSPLWCTVIIIVLALGFAAIMGAVAKSALASSDRQGAPDLDTALAPGGLCVCVRTTHSPPAPHGAGAWPRAPQR